MLFPREFLDYLSRYSVLVNDIFKVVWTFVGSVARGADLIELFPTVRECSKELAVTAEVEKRQRAASVVSHHRRTEKGVQIFLLLAWR